ncbi:MULTISPECIES: hypothetical protein [unclassified Coleofasciculus]|uniref:hypothetical protein n=1 Tax=unclassified Coleofasciculus TaxID=2692782 RepID=UPI001882575C|nr:MULTISPECIES: hypothetical protein [unclassified Coleofasciculus]MBE9128195.1 hypothetical protein [Coleofasciculus sp. LEGE 07081]MBE9150963.1 hypothetical protein [Coleofasciculus sp. LEGE 07092]
MSKLIRVHILPLIVVMASFSFPAFSPSVKSLATTQSDAVSLGIPQNKQAQKKKSIAERLADIFRRQPDTGGTQGEFCSISPSKENPYLRYAWSDRPLFVWQGKVKKIEVHPKGNPQDILWSHLLTEQEQIEQKVRYSGSQALQPGQEYFYLVTYETIENKEPITKTKEISLIVLGANHEKRSRIDAKLAEIGNQSQTMDAEELALTKAELFAEENLWLDVIRETFSVQNPSIVWEQILKDYRTKSCK